MLETDDSQHYDEDDGITNPEESDDADWFSIELQANTRYHIVVEEVGDTIRTSSSDIKMMLYNSDGEELLREFIAGGIGYTPPSTGTYYIGVESLPSTTQGTILDDPNDNYKILVYAPGAPWGAQAVSEPNGDDFHHNSGGATRGFMRVGESVTGEIADSTGIHK